MQILDPLLKLAVQNKPQRYLRFQRAFGTFVFIHINKCGGMSAEAALGIPVRIHDTAVKRRARLGEDRWNAMFKFTIVRHPYRRVLSQYHYRVMHNITGMGDNHISLNDFVQRAYGERDRRYLDAELPFKPCIDWISDKQGQILVDHIVKLENIAEEWPKICKRIGRTSTFPHVNRSASPDVVGDHFTAANIALLNDHFRRDFDVLGYERLE